jgi:hypothetical protein
MPEQRTRQPPGVASAPDPKSKPRRVADEPVAEAEAQIRKEWDPKKQGGLPTPLRGGAAKNGPV